MCMETRKKYSLHSLHCRKIIMFVGCFFLSDNVAINFYPEQAITVVLCKTFNPPLHPRINMKFIYGQGN